tara:strand:- start:931 stop:2178 length:1248 start_codon:yes stop_codon:yes gene_type:complete
MTVFNPVWKVTIGGVQYQTAILSNLTITSGRTNIYEQAQAGYTNIELINLDQATVAIGINDSLTIELQDSTATFIPIFGGSIVDIAISVAELGNVAYAQRINIIALGALSRLPKALTDGVLTQDFDGNQIAVILEDLLLNQWNEVPAALTWATNDPTEQWLNAQNLGLGEIDQPGDYELAQRASDRTDVYSLVSALATSGLGYIYEDAQGLISYAAADHRSIYLATNGYVNLSANTAQGEGLSIEQRTGDVRNNITLQYGTNSTNEVSAINTESVSLYGQLAQIFTTTVKHLIDAQDQADFYLTLRAYPQYNFNQITYQLTNPEIDDGDRDSLIKVFMGMPVAIADLPLNMSAGTYLGFVEGWTFQAAYNEISVALNLSPLAYSLQAMQWQDVSVAEAWNTISGILDWEHALVVA